MIQALGYLASSSEKKMKSFIILAPERGCSSGLSERPKVEPAPSCIRWQEGDRGDLTSEQSEQNLESIIEIVVNLENVSIHSIRSNVTN